MARIDADHWNGIVCFLQAQAPSGEVGDLLEAMQENWTEVIDKPTMIRAEKRHRLAGLKAGRDLQDQKRAELDKDIDDLERDPDTRRR